MIKEFFIKKENILISLIAIISIFFIVLGFLFLFFRTKSSEGPRIIPNNAGEIVWKKFSSKLLDKKIKYPDYMFIDEQKEKSGVGINISEIEPKEFLTYFSNQNQVSIYPSGLDNELLYGKKRESEFKSKSGQVFRRTEFLTVDNKVWAVMLKSDKPLDNWDKQGFIWLQSEIENKKISCINDKGKVTESETCDPLSKQLPVYRGEISTRFMNIAYEIINNNSF